MRTFPKFHAAAFTTPEARKVAAALPFRERYSMIKNVLFPYPQFAEVTEEVKKMHFNAGDIAATGAINALVGEYRSGKSYLIQNYVRQYQPYENEGGEIVPVIYAEGTKTWDASALPRAVLKATGGGKGGKNNDEIERAALNRLEDYEVKLIVVDDVHLFLEKPAALAGMFSFIQAALSQDLCNVILVGAPAVVSAVRQNEQLKERGGFEVSRLKAFNNRSKKGRQHFQLFLHGIDQGLPFLKDSGLGSKEYIGEFMELSKGSIGKVMNIIRAAAFAALDEGADCIGKKHLRYACRRRESSPNDYAAFRDAVVSPEMEVVEEEIYA